MPPLWHGSRPLLRLPTCTRLLGGYRQAAGVPRYALPDRTGLQAKAASVDSRPTAHGMGDERPYSNSAPAAGPSRPPHPARPPAALSAADLYKEAQIARLSALCYMEWKDLQVAAYKEGFQVVAGGDLFFTRWYLAKGVLDTVSPDAKPNTMRDGASAQRGDSVRTLRLELQLLGHRLAL